MKVKHTDQAILYFYFSVKKTVKYLVYLTTYKY